MNCPVCNRTLAPSLSICLTCGAMMNDSVREELQSKISAPVSPPHFEQPRPKPMAAAERRTEIPRPAPPLKIVTSELAAPKTSPTLVEFQAKHAAVPDWRLQLQNSVRQRMESVGPETTAGPVRRSARLVTSGATALKAEVVEEPVPEKQKIHENPTVANALQRIERSRTAFLAEPAKTGNTRSKPARNFPFNVVTGNAPGKADPAEGKLKLNEPPKPRLVPTFKIEKRKYDTNKLPPIEAVSNAEPGGSKTVTAEAAPAARPKPVVREPDVIIRTDRSEHLAEPLSDGDEIEDLAPVALRFNAALFDLIIGAFASFILMSPAIFVGAEWLSIPGLIVFLAAWSFVMFVYLTTAIGMYGKTFGMRMFALELIDAEENVYPTFRQAAVHSAVYLMTLPLLGACFFPMLFNDEQRAAHDLAAGTIIVNEL